VRVLHKIPLKPISWQASRLRPQENQEMPDIIDQDRWGICGFVSVLNGLRDAGLLTKLVNGTPTQMPLKEIQTRLYAETVAYLKYLVFTGSPLVGQIEEITRICSPKGTPKRSIDEIVRFIEGRLRRIAAWHGTNESSLQGHIRALIGGEKDNNITVAMTPDAIVDYMIWAGLPNAADLKVTTTMNTGANLLTYSNCIIGIGNGDVAGPDTPYNGLKHWIYVNSNGVLNNWGEKTQLAPGDLGTSLFGKWAIYITHVIRMS
jgi:hypothetical protein